MEQSGKLVVAGVSKTFRRDEKEIVALREVNFSVKEGRFISMIGPSGCGKSTLFNIIAGLLCPTTGQVLADGQDIVARPGTVGYMLQKDMLLPWRTILDNIILGMEIRGVRRAESVKRALPLMAQYGLKGFETQYPTALSGGMRQRAALLRTLLYDRDILLLDEPFGALDAQTRLHMQNWLLELWRDFQKTVLFVTHDIDEAIYLSDEIYVFSPRPGHIRAKIEVPIPRPRKPGDMTQAVFTELKHRLLDLLFSEAPIVGAAG
ncbi:ABC transporter ATP-binding protein [Ethanoligenens harbinense]|uniref:ABC transporter related protein n=1 Tax=Ethanoligenens harbinense (strain DSM 18485 / JCM 12961 / CGMCC 1.5033 / YUAN-3) TaxID=663278 RepID=E6U9B8_ETHHY|nr:ABC transporter ATP-binding protein [Ethanoligenens harbinense]ADU27277.1 ABC transporter related protein [Ethanoligenens harbinense YUAN-3]AVQ96342.1 ABC transporter ATP-binding protein [Ethanoligenens harbinense YUAN-3]AYF39000.1 ABC transporter ATP-binding protein [Ethanoligenens harbinense]AYF41753.1 ABC transporter ATP-binding protein [Ethanoligenens harbinense]QCN92583.1 ABC transporter ATP-binding protein [Ethanoligenens harbinense]